MVKKDFDNDSFHLEWIWPFPMMSAHYIVMIIHNFIASHSGPSYKTHYWLIIAAQRENTISLSSSSKTYNLIIMIEIIIIISKWIIIFALEREKTISLSSSSRTFSSSSNLHIGHSHHSSLSLLTHTTSLPSLHRQQLLHNLRNLHLNQSQRYDNMTFATIPSELNQFLGVDYYINTDLSLRI